MKYKHTLAGVSVIELLIWIAVAGLLIVGMSFVLGSGIRSNRFQFEQVLITEDARRQLELMSDALRNARNQGGNNWLIAAAEDSVTVQTDINQDGSLEQIRYFLDGNDLNRGITPAGQSEEVHVVARSIRNQLAGLPLFTYYNAEQAEIDPTTANSDTVARIGIAFLVDVSQTQDPGAGQIVTAIKPRAEDTETVRLWPVTLDFPSDPLALGFDEGTITVTTTDPNTSQSIASTITFSDLNDGRLATYTGDYYTHINYQDQTSGPYLPAWYAWIGPITVGTRDSSTYQVTDKVSVNPTDSLPICLGTSLDQLLLTCSIREVQTEGFIQPYFPILTYTQLTGEVDYIKDITFGGQPAATPTPDPMSCGLPTASYDNVYFSLSGQDGNHTSLHFSSDGTKLYTIGSDNKAVYQYSLATAWDLTTASYDNTSLTVLSETGAIPTGIFFKTDGTAMYILSNSFDAVYQYSLATAWDLSTATYDSISFSVATQDTTATEIFFKPDGTKMYVTGASADAVYQYSLATAWDLSSASYDSISFSVAAEQSSPVGLTFNVSGTKMLVLDSLLDTVHQYTLATAWDMSTASYDNLSFTVGGEDSNPQQMIFRTDDSSLYMVGTSSDLLHQYSLVPC